jgi:translation initiation factor 1 (eIF-1/SUI1)
LSTVLSPLAPIGDSVSESIVNTVDPDGLLEKISSGEELNEEDTDSLIDILIRMGIPEEIARILAKAYTGVEITVDDTNKVKQWIISQGYTKDDIRNMLREVGLSEDQINEIMDEYGN